MKESEFETAAEAEQVLRELAGALVPGLINVIPTMDGVTEALPDPQDILTGELYRTLLEQIPAVTFCTSFEQGLQEVYVSPQIESILGYSQKEWLSSPSLWYQRLHPEDKDRWNREFADTVMSKGSAVHRCTGSSRATGGSSGSSATSASSATRRASRSSCRASASTSRT